MKTVKVTQKDIDSTLNELDKGPINRALSCPVARALSRTFGFGVSVDGTNARNALDINYTPLPPHVIEFIDAFDHNDPIKPITFIFEFNPPVAPWEANT